MRSLLFLCHRIPYPPDKGEKIRAFRILEHLRQRFRVHLGCFVDDAADWAYVEALRPLCAELRCVGRQPHLSRIKAIGGLLTGAPLSVAAFGSRAMGTWVDALLARERPEAIFLYSSATAQFILGRDLAGARLVMDFIDVDSDKFGQYAAVARPPMRWIYAREAERLLAYDRAVAARADVSLFVSEAEAALFRQRAPESAAKITAVSNGIDCDYFSPAHKFDSPFGDVGPVFVFTGTMDYRPNIDAVVWFANEILPQLRARYGQAIFAVVGANPSRDVRALAKNAFILVTGRVPDVRPYLAHASVVVAPLRIARGIQNKVLEGMAMAKPVVTTAQGLEGIEAHPGEHIFVADTASGFAAMVVEALEPSAVQIGRAGRALMEGSYAWPRRLAALDQLL